MPTSDQIDPYYRREKGVNETDEQYADRMKDLDKRAAFFADIPVRESPYESR